MYFSYILYSFSNYHTYFKVISDVFIKDLVAANVCMTEASIKDALDKLRGAVMIVYPMNLPPHDPIRLEFEGNEDLTGTQVRSFNHQISDGVGRSFGGLSHKLDSDNNNIIVQCL